MSCLRRLVLVAILAVTASPGAARALEPGQPLEAYSVRVVGTDAGLPQARVLAIAEDARGYLWVGTLAGLGRWDGVRFTTFSPGNTERALGSVRVEALAAGEDGALFVGTHGGGAVSVTQAGRFESLRGRADRKGSAGIALLPDGKGGLWVGSWDGVTHVGPQSVRAYGAKDGLPAPPIFAITRDARGVLWAGGSGGLARWEGERFVVDRQGPLFGAPVAALWATPDGALWIGTADRGVVVRGPDGRTRTLDQGLPDAGVRDLRVDAQGQLWVATRAGLARLAPGASSFDHFAAGVLGGTIESLYEDRAGQLWVGTADDGLVRVADSILGARPLPGPPETVTSLAFAPDGLLWVGSDGGGVLALDARGSAPQVVRRYGKSDGLCAKAIAALYHDGQNLWVGGSGESPSNLCRLEADGRFRSFDAADGVPPQNNVRAFLRDRAGDLWVGGDCLFRAAAGASSFARVDVPLSPSGCPVVFALAEARPGELWVGAGAGVVRGRPGGWTEVAQRQVLAFAAPDSDDGAGFWVGALGGLGRLGDAGMAMLGDDRGYPEEPVFGVVPDGRGAVWFSSARGIHRAPAAGAEPPRRLGREDGLPTSQATSAHGQGAGLRAPDGRLWFATARGPVAIDPTRLRPRPTPAVLIEEVVVAGRASAAGSALELPAGHGDFEVRFTAPTTVGAEDLGFRYRLVGYRDERWSVPSARRQATYTGLAAGRYRFEVVTRGEAGRWSSPATLPITVAPTLGERLWFRGLVLAGFAALVFAAYWLRVRSVVARHAAVHAERTRIAREVHDTMAQGLTASSLHLELATKRFADHPEEARRALDQARRSIRLSLADARRVVWALRPEPLRRLGLPATLASIVREMTAVVPVRLQVDGEVRPLPEAAELALLRAGQEALTNALRHAAATTVTVTLSFEAARVVLSVRDDGRGLPEAAAQGPGSGLAGLRARMEEVGGTALVRSAPGGGTEVMLVVETKESRT